jgi:hypothetical protein
VAARFFKRLDGVLLLVIELPDGSPGTIPAAADVLGSAEAADPAVVLAPPGGGGCGSSSRCLPGGTGLAGDGGGRGSGGLLV